MMLMDCLDRHRRNGGLLPRCFPYLPQSVAWQQLLLRMCMSIAAVPALLGRPRDLVLSSFNAERKQADFNGIDISLLPQLTATRRRRQDARHTSVVGCGDG